MKLKDVILGTILSEFWFYLYKHTDFFASHLMICFISYVFIGCFWAGIVLKDADDVSQFFIWMFWPAAIIFCAPFILFELLGLRGYQNSKTDKFS